jgi:Na+/melibiose symporter-like transporter
LSAAAITIALAMFALYAVGYFFNQYLQFTLSYSPFEAGLRTVPIALGLMITAPVSVPMTAWLGTRAVVSAGLGFIGGALALMTQLQPHSSAGLPVLITFVLGAGIGLSLAPSTASVMGTVAPSEAGVAAALNTLTRETGGALGVAVLGSMMTWLYKGHIDAWMGVHGTPAQMRGQIRASIGGALGVARHKSQSGMHFLAQAANAAFLHAIYVTVLVALGIVLVGIVIASALLPSRNNNGQPEIDEVDGRPAPVAP